MTKRISRSYMAFITIAVMFAMTGVMVTHASEVTGTLSSDISSDSQTDGDIGGDVSSASNTDGNISGTVSNDSDTSGNISGTVSGGPETSGNLAGTVVSDSSGGGSSGGGGGTSVSLSEEPEAPSGAVLAETTDNPQAPNFPNAGAPPSEGKAVPTLWSAVITFLKNVTPF